MLLDGRILAERRWEVSADERYKRLLVGTSQDGGAIEDVASMQKSVVAFLAGVAEGKKLLDLAAPVDRYLGRGWSKAAPSAESAITVRHLMTMTSGLTDAGEYQQPAGRVWRYNTGMYSKMVPVLEKVAGSSIDSITRSWLTEPTGMSDSKWVRRPWLGDNPAANSIGFATTARDAARFGLLVLADGSWNGTDLLHDPTYLARMLKPSQELNPSYGLLWWLNGQARMQLPGEAQATPRSFIPSAPSDLVAAHGALDRRIYVVPSLRLVVTRLGDQAGEGFDNEFWRMLMRATPKR